MDTSGLLTGRAQMLTQVGVQEKPVFSDRFRRRLRAEGLARIGRVRQWKRDIRFSHDNLAFQGMK
ncbi:MAG: hypothetical protein ACTHLO_11005 [Pseudolabrys sp.]